MLSETIIQALNYALNGEIKNAYRYKMFSAICGYQSFVGAAKWFDKQWKEEQEHFEIFFKYMTDQGVIPHLLQVPEQIPETASIEELFRRTVEFEYETTIMIKQIADICKAENDEQTLDLAREILKEQIEEERTAKEIYDRIIISRNNLLVIDHELAQRVKGTF